MGISAEGEDVKFRIVAFGINISFKLVGVTVSINAEFMEMNLIR